MVNTNDLRLLYNTLSLIETRGESTKNMANCLSFIERKINEAEQEKVVNEPVVDLEPVADDK